MHRTLYREVTSGTGDRAPADHVRRDNGRGPRFSNVWSTLEHYISRAEAESRCRYGQKSSKCFGERESLASCPIPSAWLLSAFLEIVLQLSLMASRQLLKRGPVDTASDRSGSCSMAFQRCVPSTLSFSIDEPISLPLKDTASCRYNSTLRIKSTPRMTRSTPSSRLSVRQKVAWDMHLLLLDEDSGERPAPAMLAASLLARRTLPVEHTSRYESRATRERSYGRNYI